MSIFSPVDVAGPAHRGAQIQQMAQNAAQNVMRRQKLRSMLQNTTGAAQGAAGQPGQPGAGGGSFGASIPFRGSFVGHSTGVRGGTFRPGGAQHGQSMISVPGAGGGFGHYSDPGPQDLGSLPGADPHQSPASTQNGNGIIPGSWQDPNRQAGTQAVDPATGQPNGSWWVANPLDPTGAPVLGSQDGTPYHDTVPTTPLPAQGGGTSIGSGNVGAAAAGLIPLGGGSFYNPATDQIHAPGRQV